MQTDLSSAPVIGIDIGGTKIKLGLFQHDLPTIVREHPTPVAGGHAVVETLLDLCAAVIAETGVAAAAIGIGTTGQIDPINGIVLQSTGNIASWAGINLKAPLEREFSIPVVVENDVNAFALGEMSGGAGQGYASALCVTVGTGVGGALVLNGDIWRGASYSAGEVGYLWGGQDEQGKPIILEYRTGGRAMELAYQQRCHLAERLSLREVVRRASEENDQDALAVITNGATLLGQVLGATLTFFDPHVFIVGGGIPEIGELWWRPFIAELEASPLRGPKSAPVVRASLGTDAVMVGAGVFARNALMDAAQ
jgi:glucokinase